MNHISRSTGMLILFCGTALPFAGCASDSKPSLFSRSDSARLTPADFAADATDSPSSDPAAPTRLGDSAASETPGATASTSAPTNRPTPAAPAPQPPAPSAMVITGEPVTIDSVVGQINGKPVIASEVLESLDGVLRADAQAAKSAADWRQSAARRIVGELRRRIVDELVLSEARRSLTPEQRQGLLQFLETIQGRLVSQQQGSSVAADELYRQQTGRGLRQEAEDIRNQELIRFEIRQRVDPRVQVSWRDVKNEYERSFETWNPPAEYTFRMIYAAADNAAGIATLSDALQAGKPFVEVAGLEANEFVRREGGKLSRKHAGPQSSGEFSPVPELNNALRSLAVGQTIGPITYAPDPARPERRRTAWVHLEQVQTPPGTSLYDAQLDISSDLTSRRRAIEEQRYLERLLKRGNVSSIESMGERLLTIATDRYAPRFRQAR